MNNPELDAGEIQIEGEGVVADPDQDETALMQDEQEF